MVHSPFFARLLTRGGFARWLPRVQRWTNGGAAFVHYYSDRVITAPFEDLIAAAKWLEVSGPDVIDLGRLEPRFNVTLPSNTRLSNETRGWPTPWGLPELREAILERWQARLPEEGDVLITAGAIQAVHAAVEAFVNAGDRVVLFDPASPLFPLALRYRHARVHWVPTWLEAGRTRFRLESFVRALRGARLLIFNSPTNPTGGVLAADDLEQIAWWAHRRDVLILHDDSFARFQYGGDFVPIGRFERARKRTLSIGSVSSGHGLASARVGWIAGHRHLVRPCALSVAFHAPMVSVQSQQMALSALHQSDETFAPIKDVFAAKRRYAFERLQALDLPVAWPGGGLFLWVPIGEFTASGQEFAMRLLAAKNVVVWPGHFFGPSGVDHVRISYAGDDGRLREGLSRLAHFVGSVRGHEHSGAHRARIAA